MICTQVGDIKLQYDESVVDIERIVEIIKLNRYLFADYNGKTISLGMPISSKSDNIVYVPDFDKFFDVLLKMILENDNIISCLNHPDLLPSLHIQAVCLESIKNGDTPFMLDNNLSYDMLWFLIACKYFDYKTEFNELSNFLKYHNDSERILDWLKETQRFETYNYLLKCVSNYLKEYDLLFLDNIDEIFSKINEKNMEVVLSLLKEKDYDFPKMSLDDLERTFLDFLNSIKAPVGWKNLYTELKNKNRILFEESEDGLEHSEVFVDDDGIRKIRLTTDGTINCFVSFVHEFVHYVSLQGETPPFSLLEFPSIYYERIAANYLISVGYDENIIKQVIRDRNKDNFVIYSSLFGLLLDICIYNKKGQITKDDRIEPLKKSMDIRFETIKKLVGIAEDAGESIENLDFLTMPNYNFEEIANEECDENISLFIKSGFLVLNGYQYLVDSLLVDSMLEKENNDTTLDKMRFVTEHLVDFNVEKIINYLEISNAFDSRNGKKYIKK